MKDRTLDKDTRYVYGARCMWHDNIQKAGSTKPQTMNINGRLVRSMGLPCCPYCGSMLFESPTKEAFFKGAEDWDKKHPNYLKLLTWSQGKCFQSMKEIAEAYNRETGENLVYD